MKPKRASAQGFAESAFVHYATQLHRFLTRRLRHRQDAEDLAQEVFMRLSRIENADFVRQPRAYLFGMASHVVSEFRIRDAHAREWITVDSEVVAERSDHPAELATDEIVDRLSLQQELAQALERLPPLDLAVFLLHKRDGYSYEEIADRLGMTERKVERCLAEAKARLRSMTWDR